MLIRWHPQSVSCNMESHATESTKTKRKELMNKEFVKSSMALSLLWSCHLLVVWEKLPQCATSVSLLWSPPNVTVAPWPGSDVAYHFPFFAHLSNASWVLIQILVMQSSSKSLHWTLFPKAVCLVAIYHRVGARKHVNRLNVVQLSKEERNK